jgi:hypothetical protein
MIFTYNITKKGNDMKKSNITKISEYANRADLINDMIRDCRYPGQDGVELFDSRIKFVANQVQMAYNQKQQYNEGNPEYRIKGRNHWDSKAQEIESPDFVLADDQKTEMMEQLKELRAADDAAYEFWNAEYKFFSDVYQFITGKAWTKDTPKSEKVNNVKAFLLK